MQSLEEEALLKGTLAARGAKSSAMIKGVLGGGKGRVGVGGGAGKEGTGGDGDGGDEPQTDGEETDDYSDQVSIAARVLYYSTVLVARNGTQMFSFRRWLLEERLFA